MFRVTESIATRGTLDIDPIEDGTGGGFASASGENGKEYAQYGLGNSITALPFYAVGALACRVVPDETASRLLDFKTVIYAPQKPGTPGYGHALFKRAAVSVTGTLIFALTCAVLWVFGVMIADKFTEQQVPNRDRRLHLLGWMTALAYGAGTMAWPHARTFFSEPLAALGMIAAFATAVGGSGRLTVKRALGTGMCFALAMLARLDSAVVLPGLALTGLLRFASDELGGDDKLKAANPETFFASLKRPLFLKIVLAFLIPTILFLFWNFYLNWSHFGNAFTSAYADQTEGIKFSTPLIAGLYGFLFSAGKGVFFFSPCLLLAVFGWKALTRGWLPVAAGLALALLGLIAFHARWQNWAGGWCWGPRHFFCVGALAVPAATAWLAQFRRTRLAVFAVILTAGIGVQLYACSQSFVDYYILYFRTPEQLPQARPLYSAEDYDPMTVKLERIQPDNSIKPITFGQLTAPIQDSIYVPQNSQWSRYTEMWHYGFTDNLWLRLMKRANGTERDVLTGK